MNDFNQNFARDEAQKYKTEKPGEHHHGEHAGHDHGGEHDHHDHEHGHEHPDKLEEPSE